MLVKVGVCAPAIEEISEQAGVAYAKVIHAALAEFLAAHGNLVISNSREMLDLVRLARASELVDQRARRIWSVLIQELRKQGRIQVLNPGSQFSLAEISTAAQLAGTWPAHQVPEAAMVPSSFLKLLFPDAPGTVKDPSTGVILANPAEFLESEPIQRLRTLREESRVPFGQTRKSFWQFVLNPLAQSSKEVTIYDRYLFSEITKRDQSFPTPGQPHEALVWLLRMLDDSARNGLVVRLFAATAAPHHGSAQHPVSAQQALEILKKFWVRPPRGAISRVEIVAGPWKQNGKLMPHDRHIRFSENRAISIPAGLDRLKAATIEDTAGMAWKYHWSTATVAPLISSEKELESGHLTKQVVL